MNANKFWIALPVLGLVGLTALAGYFWRGEQAYGEIEGRVMRGGVPLEQVEVVFYPEEDGTRSVALTDKDGHFEAMTDAIQKVPARKGAPVGKYRVTVVDRRDQILAAEQRTRAMSGRAGPFDPKQLVDPALPLEKKKKAPIRVPPQYNLRLDTPFHDIEIKPGTNWFDLDVK